MDIIGSSRLTQFHRKGCTGVALEVAPMTIRINFTKPSLEAIMPDSSGKRLTVHDAKNPGLICLIYPSGARTFFVLRKLTGRTERIKIGAFPTVSIEQARKQAEMAPNC